MLFLNKKQKFLSNDTFTLTTDQLGNPLTTSGILTNEANVGFEVPADQSKYLTAGNDVVDLSKWNGTLSVNIGDAFSSDNDKVTVMAGALQKNNLKLTSIENLEIVNSGVETSVTLTGANFKGLEAIKLIGDKTTLNVAGLTQGVKIDATADADHITGSSKADTINGGAGNDIINAGSGNDVLTGGNGADTFIVGSVQSLGIDQILDFSAEDKISMTGFTVGNLKKFDASTFSTVTYKTLDSVLATFATGGANVTKNGDVVIFSYDGKTYALLANGAFDEKTDALVDITGANVASLTESNFGEAVSLYTYENYADFKTAITNGERIPDGEAVIKTMTVANATTLNTTDSVHLSKIAAGGIKAITDGNTITVAVPVDGGIGEFDARIFDSKLAADVRDVTLNINGSNNSDIIYASKLGGTITAGSGVDRITLNAGADTVVFESTPGANGVDTITGFKAGTDGDKLDVSTLLGEVKGLQTVTAINGTGTATDVTANNVIVLNATTTDKLVFTSANNTKVFIVDATNNNVYLYTATNATEVNATAVLTTANQVATLTGVTATELVDANFIGTAP